MENAEGIMRMDYTEILTRSVRTHAQGHIEKHIANVKVLMSNTVGVAEHPDIVETIEKELDHIARYHDQLEVLNRYFKDTRSSQLLNEGQKSS